MGMMKRRLMEATERLYQKYLDQGLDEFMAWQQAELEAIGDYEAAQEAKRDAQREERMQWSRWKR